LLALAVRIAARWRMTWNTTDITEQKLLFIQAVQAATGESFADCCARFGISRETGYQTLRRYEQLGLAGLAPASKRPLHSPFAVTAEIEKLVLHARIEHPTWGPRKLLAFLKRRSPRTRWPAPSTLGELLRRQGLAHPRPARRTQVPFTQPLGHALVPNDVWCADFKGWFRTRDRARCNPLTISDASTRMLLRCHHVARPDYATVRPLFEATFREFGLPHAIRTDNGPPFSSLSLAGLSRLSVWWIRLGIWPERTEPGHPEQNGRHERIHRTMQLDVADVPAANLRLQQRALERFRVEYNTVRPHEALDNRSPADLHRPSPRAFPEKLPDLEYPPGVITRSVRPNGEFRHAGHSIFLAQPLAGQRIALWEIDGGWDVYFGIIWLGRLDAATKKLTRAPTRPVPTTQNSPATT
jgi:putative transposase